MATVFTWVFIGGGLVLCALLAAVAREFYIQEGEDRDGR